jgi:hypothetical protein
MSPYEFLMIKEESYMKPLLDQWIAKHGGSIKDLKHRPASTEHMLNDLNPPQTQGDEEAQQEIFDSMKWHADPLYRTPPSEESAQELLWIRKAWMCSGRTGFKGDHGKCWEYKKKLIEAGYSREALPETLQWHELEFSLDDVKIIIAMLEKHRNENGVNSILERIDWTINDYS